MLDVDTSDVIYTVSIERMHNRCISAALLLVLRPVVIYIAYRHVYGTSYKFMNDVIRPCPKQHQIFPTCSACRVLYTVFILYETGRYSAN